MRRERVPLVSIELLLPAGAQLDPPERPGLATFHAGLLDEGTQTRDALTIAGQMERFGGLLRSTAGWEFAAISIELLATYLDAGLEMLADISRHPGFPPDEVERLRNQRLTELLRRRTQPTALAERYLARAVYGNSPYGHTLLGTEESAAQFDRHELLSFYRQHIAPRGSTLIAVGDLQPDALVSAVQANWGDWSTEASSTLPEIEVAPLERTIVHIVDRPGAAQTQLLLGHAGVPRHHPDHPSLVVLNALFGGMFTSRINLNLRERHGFTYGAHSSLAFRRGAGPFVIRAAVATESTGAAVRELLHEMNRVREEPVPKAELKETCDFVVSVFPYTLQTLRELKQRLESLVAFGLPDDYYEDYPAMLADMSQDMILNAARRHFHPERVAIVAVGPAVDLQPQLAPFGPVEVITP